MPIGLTATRPEIAASFKGLHISTFGGNPVAACAALAVLDVIEDERLIENAMRVGGDLIASLRGLGIGEVRGRGLLIGVELESPELAEDVVNRMRDAGVLVNRTGPLGSVLKIRPPLVFAAEHIELLVGALAAAADGSGK